MNQMSKKPTVDFIGIGTPKAATSWIHQCLDEHPALCGSRPKELHFFNRDDVYQWGVDWYQQHFQHCANTTLCGEFDPNYLQHPKAPERIQAYAPKAKLIACLRNPIDRHISARTYRTLNTQLSTETFKKMLLEDDSCHKPYAHWRAGRYAEHLRRYLRFFPREQIGIFIYERISEDPVAFVQNIYRFLGVDDTYIPPSAYNKKNVTSRHRYHSQNVHRIIWRLYRFLIKWSPHTFLSLLRHLHIQKFVWHLYSKLNVRANASATISETPVISSEIRERIRQYYADDIRTLETLIGRDLHFWK